MSNPKQRDIFGITVLNNSHGDIRRLRREHGQTRIHGNKFWKSTSLMIDYLQVAPPSVDASRPCRILEVGCGWGIAGIYCAKHFGAQVTALDADAAVFAYLNHHAALNQVNITTLKCRYEKVTTAMLAEFDLVIGSDICFWDEMTAPLFNLIKRAHKAGVGRVVITDPGRDPFRQMAERCLDKFEGLYDRWAVPHPYNISGLVLDIACS